MKIIDPRPMSETEKADVSATIGDVEDFDAMAREMGFVQSDAGEYWMPECVQVYALLYAFGEGEERLIDIPKDQWDKAGLDGRLELAYKYGQNMFQARKAPSLSVGDVVDLGSMELYIVKMTGFKPINVKDLGRWSRVPQRDRSFHEMVR